MFGSRSLPQVMAAQRLLAMMQAQSPQGQMPRGQSLPGATPMGANPGGAPSAPQPFANAKLPQTPGAVTAPKPAAAPMAPGPATPMGPLPGQAPLFGRRPLSKQGAPAATPAALGAPAADGGAPITWTPPPALVAGLPGGRSAPSPAAADDQPITVSTRFQPYDGPLAMEEGRGTYQRPPMTWAERLQIIGATMQQMGAPDGQIAATTGAMDTRHRQRFQEERDNRMFETRIAGLRNLAAHVERENPEHPWLRVLGQFESPQQAVDAYFAYEDRLRDQGNFERSQGFTEEMGRGDLTLRRDGLNEDIRQFDQGYLLNERELEAQIEAMEAGTAQGWAAQNTRDRELQYNIDLGGRDPLARERISSGVDRVQAYQEAAGSWQGIIPLLNEFRTLNQTENTGWGLNSFTWGQPNRERMEGITAQLTPQFLEQMAGVASESDRAMIQQGLPQLGRNRDTNTQTINALQRAGSRMIERALFADAALTRDRSLTGFEREWAEYVASTPLSSDVTFEQWRGRRQAAQGLSDQALVAEAQRRRGSRAGPDQME